MLFLARVADEIPDDEEVAGIFHLLDHRDLVGQTVLVVLDRMAQRAGRVKRLQADQPLRESFAHDVLEVIVQRVGGRHREVRQVVLVGRNIDVAPFGDAQRVCERLGDLAEDLLHFRGGLQIELIAVVPQPIAIVDVLAGADAQQDVVRPMIAVEQVMHVVGRDERHVQLARDRRQPFVDDQLLVDALILHLEEKVARPENVAKLRGGLERLPLAPRTDFARHFALEAAAEPNQSLRVLREQVFVDARLVIEPLGVA